MTVRVCARCGSGTTEPYLSGAELAPLYPETYGPYADADGRLTAALSSAIRTVQGKLILRRFPLAEAAGGRPGRGLDVGCGRGDLAARLIAAGWAMDGIEPSPAACEAARGRGVAARAGTLETVALEPGAYDLVVFQHSLEHTAEPVADLERVRDALAPGGLLAVTVPAFGSWQARRFRDRWYHLDLPRHRTHFTEAGLKLALDRAGLSARRFATSTSNVGRPASAYWIDAGLCTLLQPLARLADRLGGGGDQLHVVAERAS